MIYIYLLLLVGFLLWGLAVLLGLIFGVWHALKHIDKHTNPVCTNKKGNDVNCCS